ncbi:hypothetical protein HYI16_18170, partial [Clostridium botulinum]|nr:hypothetical protein [Clostridium botulinum]
LPTLYPPQEMDNLFDDCDEKCIEEEEKDDMVSNSIVSSSSIISSN